MTEIDQENVSIYVETLFALARDAWRRGKLETFDFIVEDYLTGLVPSNALRAFVDGLDPNHGTNVRARVLRPDTSGGAKVTNPTPPPRLPPAPTFAPRESSTLRW